MDKENINGTIFNIQRFSVHDGPGIRTLVFLKGCPLRCKWCSNPEGLSGKIDIMYDKAKCIGCGECLKVCEVGAITFDEDEGFPIDRELCILCGNCAIVCPTDSKKIYGEQKTVEQIVNLVKRDSTFYKSSGGGLTLGGGEILFQPEFAYEILKDCKSENINTAIETSGMGSLSWLEKISEFCDTIYYDIKAMDSTKHKSLTKVNNEVILNNLISLDKKIAGMEVKPTLIIRMPLINGYNTDELDIKQAAMFIKDNLTSYSYVELLPFHNFGEQKYNNLDLHYEFEGELNSKVEELDPLLKIVEDMDIPVRIVSW